MSDLNDVGDRDGWRCWLCDEPVDPEASVNADRGPSVDSWGATKGKKPASSAERLAHRACNTRKGKVQPVVPWAPQLFVVDPAPIVATVERLRRWLAARVRVTPTRLPRGSSTGCRDWHPNLQ